MVAPVFPSLSVFLVDLQEEESADEGLLRRRVILVFAGCSGEPVPSRMTGIRREMGAVYVTRVQTLPSCRKGAVAHSPVSAVLVRRPDLLQGHLSRVSFSSVVLSQASPRAWRVRMSQMKPTDSRATATVVFVLSFPLLLR